MLHRCDMNALSERVNKPWWWKWTKTKLNWTEQKKKWTQERDEYQNCVRNGGDRETTATTIGTQHTRFPSSEAVLWLWLGIYYWCTICKSHSNPKLLNVSQLLSICWCYSFFPLVLSPSSPFPFRSIDWHSITLFFVVIRLRNKQLTVCPLLPSHICSSAIKCRIFHIKFRGFNRTIFAFFSLYFIGFLHHTIFPLKSKFIVRTSFFPGKTNLHRSAIESSMKQAK